MFAERAGGGVALEDEGALEAADDLLEFGPELCVVALAAEHFVEEVDAVDDVFAHVRGCWSAQVVEVDEFDLEVNADSFDEDVAGVEVAVVVAAAVDLLDARDELVED